MAKTYYDILGVLGDAEDVVVGFGHRGDSFGV